MAFSFFMLHNLTPERAFFCTLTIYVLPKLSISAIANKSKQIDTYSLR